MKGISYITDNKGKQTALVVDMKFYAQEIQDFLDGLVAESRRKEPKADYKKFIGKILKKRKLGPDV